MMYKVIQSNSAVKRRCSAFVILNTSVKKIKKNKIKYKFISPKNIIYSYDYYLLIKAAKLLKFVYN